MSGVTSGELHDGNVSSNRPLPSGRAILTTFGWGCFLALQTYFGLCYALPLAESYSFDASILLRTGAVVALLVALSACSLKTRWLFENFDRIIAPAAVVGCVPFAYEAIHLSFGLSVPGAIAAVLSLLVWMCLGVSFLLLGLVWCVILSQNTFRQSMGIIAVGAAMSVVIYFTTSCIHPSSLSLLMSAFVLVAGYGCAYVLIRSGEPRVRVAPPGEGGDKAERAKPSSQEVLWHTVYNAVYAYMLLISATQGFAAVVIVGSCGIVGALLAIFAELIGPEGFPESRKIYQLSLPLVVVMFLLLPYFEGSWGVVLCAGITVAFNSLATILYWAESTSLNAEFYLDPVERFAEYSYPKWLGMLVGSIYGYLACATSMFDGEARFIASIVVVGVLLMCFMAFSLRMEREENAVADHLTESHPLEAVQSDDVETACKFVAEEGGLSPRESEILVLLAKGRNARYIQENLFISLSTARSHIYHIYQKLDVSSQQGLIDLIEGRR